jgi:hypothetical protein
MRHCGSLCIHVQCDLSNFFLKLTDGVTMWRCDDVTMWRCDDVTVWRCDGVTVWRCDGVTVWRCDDVTVWRCDGVTDCLNPRKKCITLITVRLVQEINKSRHLLCDWAKRSKIGKVLKRCASFDPIVCACTLRSSKLRDVIYAVYVMATYISISLFWGGGGVDKCILWLSFSQQKEEEIQLQWMHRYLCKEGRRSGHNFEKGQSVVEVYGPKSAKRFISISRFNRSWNYVLRRVARFFWVQFTNTGKNILNCYKIWIPNGHKMYLSNGRRIDKCPLYNILTSSIARASKIYPNCNFGSENIQSGNLGVVRSYRMSYLFPP